jgi:hypothetical protein
LLTGFDGLATIRGVEDGNHVESEVARVDLEPLKERDIAGRYFGGHV